MQERADYDLDHDASNGDEDDVIVSDFLKHVLVSLAVDISVSLVPNLFP